MKKRLINLLFMAFSVPLASCLEVYTEPFHSSLFPKRNASIEYELTFKAEKGKVKLVRLFHSIGTYNESRDSIEFGNEMELKEWEYRSAVKEDILTFTLQNGYQEGWIVSYRFELESPAGATVDHKIFFGLNPYPDIDKSVPVYAQSGVDKGFNIMLIPDQDIVQGLNIPEREVALEEFYSNLSSIIRKTIYREPTLKSYSKQFNFYTIHDFGEAKVNGTDVHTLCSSCDINDLGPMNIYGILHKEQELQDNVDPNDNRRFSSEWDSAPTVLHEIGHSLFGLWDEYNRGYHEEALIYPNNWEVRDDAISAAISIERDEDAVKQIGNENWYRICLDNCQMRVGGESDVYEYDIPCTLRLIYEIEQNANNN